MQPGRLCAIPIAVEAWLEVELPAGKRKHALAPGLTRLAAEGGDIQIPGAGQGELHLWDRPPKLLYLGAGGQPRVNGKACDESALSHGDAIEWGSVRLTFGFDDGQAALEEIPVAATPAAVPASALAEADERLWRRLKAGMLVELGLGDKAAARRWQDSISRGGFEPDSCARDLLGGVDVSASDPRLVERSGRLMRDLVMVPVTRGVRGAGRKLRGAARSGLAFAVMQLVVFAITAMLVVVAMFLGHLNGWSIDEFFEGILSLFRG